MGQDYHHVPNVLQHYTVAYPINMQSAIKNNKKNPNGFGIGQDGDPSPTLGANDKHAVATYSVVQEAAYTTKLHNTKSNQGGDVIVQPIGLDEEQNAMINKFGTLKARTAGGGFEGTVMQSNMMVRRLTPRECERLQGFPDDFTAIPWRNKPVEQCPDGPRYKVLGNSMAVPVMRWIGERIQKVEETIKRTTT